MKGVPDETYVSRVEPSHFDAGAVLRRLRRHRTDDHKPYVYVTKDYGETWTSISGNLPTGNVNVIREDPKNRNLLYARHRVRASTSRSTAARSGSGS